MRTNNEEPRKRNRFGTSSRKATWLGVGFRLKQVLPTRNLTFNSDVALNYKYMFSPHRDLYLICEISQ